MTGINRLPDFDVARSHALEAAAALFSADIELAECLLCEALVALRAIPNREGGDPLRDDLADAARAYLNDPEDEEAP